MNNCSVGRLTGLSPLTHIKHSSPCPLISTKGRTTWKPGYTTLCGESIRFPNKTYGPATSLLLNEEEDRKVPENVKFLPNYAYSFLHGDHTQHSTNGSQDTTHGVWEFHRTYFGQSKQDGYFTHFKSSGNSLVTCL